MSGLLKGLDLLPGWAWALLCAAAIATAAVNAHHVRSLRTQHAQEVVGWERERAIQAQANAQAQAQAREREQTLQAAADQARQEKTREIHRLNSVHAAALDSLRKRPERPPTQPSPVPAPAGSGGGERSCDGSQLYREDAEFLLGEALRADQIRLQLAACQAAYGTARGLTGP